MSSIRTLFHEQLARLTAESGPRGRVSGKLTAFDLFVDTKRSRIYVSCGEGFLDVFDARASDYGRLARVRMVRGARTSYYVPSMDRLFLAVRAASSEPAAVWVCRPTP